MTREENETQLTRMAEKLEDWRTATGRYVPVGGPEQGEVVLEETELTEAEINDEEIYPQERNGI